MSFSEVIRQVVFKGAGSAKEEEPVANLLAKLGLHQLDYASVTNAARISQLLV